MLSGHLAVADGAMKVLVFDIDGTLTATTAIDDVLFRAAVRAVVPEVQVESLSEFVEFTDTAILQELCAAHTAREYSAVEPAVRRHFLAGLEGALVTDPEAFRPVPGAREIFDEVRGVGWTPAIATGGWRRSAELKLSAAGIPTSGVPLVTSSETPRRADIIRLAVDQAAAGARPSDVVYVGDGTWDVRACRELSIGFVGRSTSETLGRLVQHGARAAIPDFSDPSALIRLLGDSESLTPSDDGTRART